MMDVRRRLGWAKQVAQDGSNSRWRPRHGDEPRTRDEKDEPRSKGYINRKGGDGDGDGDEDWRARSRRSGGRVAVINVGKKENVYAGR